MIYPDDANDFSDMMDATWQSLGRNTVDRATKKYWFGKLQTYNLGDVAQAFDKYLDANRETLPHFNDIINFIKPNDNFYAIEKKPLTLAENKLASAKVMQHIAKNLNPKQDMLLWAKKIMENPKNYPPISLKFAKEALSKGYQDE